MDIFTNIQSWPTPEMFIRFGNPSLDMFDFAAGNFGLTGVVTYTDIMLPSLADNARGSFALITATFGFVVLNQPINDSSNGSFALSGFASYMLLTGPSIADNANPAFSLASFFNATQSTVSLSDFANTGFSLTTLTA